LRYRVLSPRCAVGGPREEGGPVPALRGPRPLRTAGEIDDPGRGRDFRPERAGPMSTPSNAIARMWRTVLPRRGSVARTSDRVQAGLLVLAVLLALAALPVAASIGSETYARQ